MQLTITQGPLRGRTLDAPEPVAILGRSSYCDVVLDSEKVSREHARLFLEGEELFIADLQSTNGVRVNGLRLRERQRLLPGDLVTVGDYVFTVALKRPALTVVAPAGQATPETAAPPAQAPVAPAAPGDEDLRIHPAVYVPILALLIAATVWAVWPASQRGSMQELSGHDPLPVVSPSAATGTDSSVAAPPPTAPLASPASPGVPASSAPEPQAGYLWLTTQPPGAEVRVRGQLKGLTPLVLEGLPDGPHQVNFQLAGCLPRAETLTVPSPGTLQTFALQQAPGTCLLRTTPPGVSVFNLGRLLGRTPLLLWQLPPGTHRLRLEATLCQAEEIELTLPADQPVEKSVTLHSTATRLKMRVMPAAARVILDGDDKGTAASLSPNIGAAIAGLELGGLEPGRHEVRLEYQGCQGSGRTITLAPAETLELDLLLWFPDTVVNLRNGQRLNVMLADRKANGDLLVIERNSTRRLIPAAELQGTQPLPPAQARQIVKGTAN